jgi:hypothetical protein
MKFGGVKPSHEYQMGVLSLKQKKKLGSQPILMILSTPICEICTLMVDQKK